MEPMARRAGRDDVQGRMGAGYGYAANDAVTYGSPASTYIAQIGNSSETRGQSNAGPYSLRLAAQAHPPDRPGRDDCHRQRHHWRGGHVSHSHQQWNSSAAVLNFTIPQGATDRWQWRQRQQRHAGHGGISHGLQRITSLSRLLLGQQLDLNGKRAWRVDEPIFSPHLDSEWMHRDRAQRLLPAERRDHSHVARIYNLQPTTMAPPR